MGNKKKTLHDAQTDDSRNVKPEFTYEEWANTLRKIYQKPFLIPVQPGEYTVEETAKATGMTYESARRMLIKMMEEGKLERFDRLKDGHVFRVYREKKEVNPLDK